MVEEEQKYIKKFCIRIDAQWWIKGHSEVEAIQHLIKVIYRDKFLDEHSPYIRCVDEKAIEDEDPVTQARIESEVSK